MGAGSIAVSTPLGMMEVWATGRGVVRVQLPRSGAFMERRAPPGVDEILEMAREQLAQYFTGHRRRFSCPLDVRGTPFQRRVWEVTADIPWGRTMTYGRVAELSGSRGGARAVGRAMADNPVPILVPCHRVVASRGLGGFGGGLDMKRWLLTLEGAQH